MPPSRDDEKSNGSRAPREGQQGVDGLPTALRSPSWDVRNSRTPTQAHASALAYPSVHFSMAPTTVGIVPERVVSPRLPVEHRSNHAKVLRSQEAEPVKRAVLALALALGCGEPHEPDVLAVPRPASAEQPAEPVSELAPVEIVALLAFDGLDADSEAVQLIRHALAQVVDVLTKRELMHGRELNEAQIEGARQYFDRRLARAYGEMRRAEKALPGETREGYVRLWNWLARQAREEREQLTESHEWLVEAGFEREFIRYVHQRWPPAGKTLGPYPEEAAQAD
ncbi:MAG: hypothetical protein AAGD14_02860 [Planctomycetota bacterium]